MFDPSSRYYPLPLLTETDENGRTLTYISRRFLPQGSQQPLVAQIIIREGDRIDLIAAQALGDSLLFWRICDANDAMDPLLLVEQPGQRLRITQTLLS